MSKTNLILHCGAAAVSFEEIIKVPTPEATDTWHPIAHSGLVHQVRKGLDSLGLHVVQEAHALTREGSRYFGLLQISRTETADKDDYAYVLGLRNSHDKSFPAGLLFGNQVFVCDNLAFNGEIRVARRHTRHIMDDLPILVNKGISLLSERWNRMDDRIAKYKEVELNDARVHDFVIRSLDAGACVARQIPEIVSEWRKPRHPEFQPRTAWSLFNSYTEIAKTGSLVELPNRTTRLHGLLDVECGLTFTNSLDTSEVSDTDVVISN